jgi:hypothetical protein
MCLRATNELVIHRVRSRNRARGALPLQTVIRSRGCTRDRCAALLVPGLRSGGKGHSTGDAAVTRRVGGG